MIEEKSLKAKMGSTHWEQRKQWV